jgi:hypothetical protein
MKTKHKVMGAKHRRFLRECRRRHWLLRRKRARKLQRRAVAAVRRLGWASPEGGTIVGVQSMTYGTPPGVATPWIAGPSLTLRPTP